MIYRLGPLILLSTLTLSQTKGDGQITQTVVKPGDNFTMACSLDKTEAGLLYFYKVSLDSLIQTVAEGSFEKITLQGDFRIPRFSVTLSKQNENIRYSFTISKVTREDGASYLCQAGSSYKMSFHNTTLLIILDQGNHTFYIKQIPQVSVPLGSSVKLNCSLVSKNKSPMQCPSKRRVHWFRSGAEESPANIIYTYVNQTEEQDQRRCVYSLSTSLLDFNDTGTYYCAVATCGHVLFGNGTIMKINSDEHHTDMTLVCSALGVLLFCSAVINVAMLCLYRRAAHHKGGSSNSIEILDTTLADQSNNEDDQKAGVNYVALEFPLRKAKKSNIKNELQPECFYSVTRNYQFHRG